MYRLLLIAATLIFFTGNDLLAGDVTVKRIDATSLQQRWVTPITLEHAVTRKQLQWGLMARQELPGDHGMTFNFPTAKKRQFWMFNTLMDLSLAFLDDYRVIRELRELKAFPEKMDPKRPVHSTGDLSRYTASDPVVAFFLRNAITSSGPTHYALEMASKWFASREVKVGDVVLWNTNHSKGLILHTLSLASFVPTEEQPIALELPGNNPHSVWLPEGTSGRQLFFFTEELQLISSHALPAPDLLAPEQLPVVVSEVPVKFLVIGAEGWLPPSGEILLQSYENRITVRTNR